MNNPATQYGPGDLITAPFVGSPCDPRYNTDANADRDELIDQVAESEWMIHIGEGPMLGSMVCDAVFELTDTWARKPELMEELAAAHLSGPEAFGRWLHPQIEGFWRQWCRDKAEGYLSLMEREQEAEAAAARMGG